MGSDTLAVVCVLKTGGDFLPEHVLLLQKQVAEYLTLPHQFICLSNVQIPGVYCVPLTKGWPGWWSKIELFRHDFGRTLFMDLDTVIVGNIDELAGYEHTFTALQALSDDQRPSLASGVMAWRGPRLDLYDKFSAQPDHFIATCNRAGNWGDQGFIYHHVGHWDAWQNLFPGQIVSFKKHLKRRLPPPKSTSIVCFHGKPRPWESNAAWLERKYFKTGKP
jgi:hypothetical protein